MTYNEAKKDAKDRLTAAGIADAAIDSGYLLEHLTKKNRSELFLIGNDPMPEEMWHEYVELVEKRCNHVPFAYITGERDFFGRTFKVNENVLIPSPDTEILILEALKYLKPEQRILDMCTGSGCILITLLLECKGVTGTGADISGAALEVAKENARLYGLLENDDWILTDLFKNISGQYDMITANPPYIDTEVLKGLMPEVKDFEPSLALDGGKDGLVLYKPLAEGAFRHLKDGGWFLTEIGFDQGPAVAEILRDAGFDCVEIIKDLATDDRVVKGKKNVR